MKPTCDRFVSAPVAASLTCTRGGRTHGIVLAGALRHAPQSLVPASAGGRVNKRPRPLPGDRPGNGEGGGPSGGVVEVEAWALSGDEHDAVAVTCARFDGDDCIELGADCVESDDGGEADGAIEVERDGRRELDI